MPLYEVSFEVSNNLAAIDAEAMRISAAREGTETYWLFYMRRGMQGFASRLYGARLHYNSLHCWLPRRFTMYDAEYHLASVLFNMDSAIECLTFAMNALGNAERPNDFCDVTVARSLRDIHPANVVPGPRVRPGYAACFPRTQAFWSSQTDLIEDITEFHDVTKHRHALAGNGQLRRDPPTGFFDGLNVAPAQQLIFAPFAETIIGPEAKQPMGARMSTDPSQVVTLEHLMERFKPFVEETLTHLVADARAFP